MSEKTILPNRLAVSVPQAAEMIGISPPKVYELIRCGDLPAKHVGHRWLISMRNLEKWINDEL